MSGPKDDQLDYNAAQWQAESYRLSAFLSPSAQLSEQDLWERLTGELPERKSVEPKKGIQQEEGKFKDTKLEGQLILTAQPTRIDWQLVPRADLSELGAPTIGIFSESVEVFLTLMLRWLELAPSVQRLAFGAVLTQPTNSLKDGLHDLSRYLPTIDLDENSSDFFYQINRPRKFPLSNFEDFSINRLSKWTVYEWEFGLFIGPDPTQFTQYSTTSKQFTIRLELDINTSASFASDLNPDELPGLLQKLVEYGKEIALEGDIK